MIKFRAWDKVQKVMMVPRDIQTDSDGNIFYVEAMGPDGEYDEGDLDVFELEQFTGLTDVNGKDIYVGDIVKYRNLDEKYQYLKIRWLQQDCMIDAGGYRIDIIARRCEVIGNVHADPELLKG